MTMSKDAKKLVKRCKAVGWTVTKTALGHYRIEGGTEPVYAGLRGGDHRALKNTEAFLRRVGLEEAEARLAQEREIARARKREQEALKLAEVAAQVAMQRRSEDAFEAVLGPGPGPGPGHGPEPGPVYGSDENENTKEEMTVTATATTETKTVNAGIDAGVDEHVMALIQFGARLQTTCDRLAKDGSWDEVLCLLTMADDAGLELRQLLAVMRAERARSLANSAEIK